MLQEFKLANLTTYCRKTTNARKTFPFSPHLIAHRSVREKRMKESRFKLNLFAYFILRFFVYRRLLDNSRNNGSNFVMPQRTFSDI